MTTPTREPLVGLAERLERWPGYEEQSWQERFTEMELRYRRSQETAVHALYVQYQRHATALEEQSRRVEELTERCARLASSENAMRDNLVLMGMARDRYLELLRPFALAADDLDDKHRDGSPIWEAPAAMSIDAGHLRDARTALTPSDTGA